MRSHAVAEHGGGHVLQRPLHHRIERLRLRARLPGAPPRAPPCRGVGSRGQKVRTDGGEEPGGLLCGRGRAIDARARERLCRRGGRGDGSSWGAGRGKGRRIILGRRAGRVLRALRGRQAARAGGCAGPVGGEQGGGQHRRARGGRAARDGARRDRRARSRPWTAPLHAHDPPQRARRRACIGRGRRRRAGRGARGAGRGARGAGRGARGAGRTGRGGAQGWRRSRCRGGGTRAPRAP
jgi:hypothetical protein